VPEKQNHAFQEADGAAAVFFLVRPAAAISLDRAQLADPLVDAHQLLAEFLEAVKLGDLLLGLRKAAGFGNVGAL
jgi:hypothetical protein